WIGSRTSGAAVADPAHGMSASIKTKLTSERHRWFDTLRLWASTRLVQPGGLHRAIAVLALPALTIPATVAAQSPRTLLTNFPTEQQAQRHCPNDTVVWLNLPTGIYQYRDQRWYGAHKSGVFVCHLEAKQTGMRNSSNEQ